jgi:hypothetical protein
MMQITNQEALLIKTIFLCSILLVSASAYIFITTPQESRFFQAWIIGPNGLIPEPVLMVSPSQTHSMSLGVQNTMGDIEYCNLTTKFQSMPLANSSLTNVSTSSIDLTNFRFLILGNEIWTRNVNFRVDSTVVDNTIIVRGIELDNSYFTTNLTSIFDSVRNGFFWQFRFELWAFNTSSNDFYFTNTLVSSPLLNITR